MILKTERLELVPLRPYQLRLWVYDGSSTSHVQVGFGTRKCVLYHRGNGH